MAGLIPDLCDECGYGQSRNDPVLAHGGVQYRNKNAGLAAGVGEDLQQLLLGDRHAFLQVIKCPLSGGQF